MVQLAARILSDDHDFKTQISQLLRSTAVSVTVTVATDPFTHDSAAPDVILVDVRGESAAAMLSVEQLRARMPATCIFAVALEPDPNLILKAMRAGVNEFLLWPPAEDTLNEALRRALHRRDAAKEAAPVSKTLAFFGAKGGAGTTTVAVNCGVDLARLSKKPTVIVDLKPGLGEVGLFLGVRPKYGLLDAVDNLPRLDRHMLQSLVVKHKSGLEILAGSDQFDRPSAADAGALGELFRLLARNYEYVVIDAGNQINSRTVAALAGADRIYLVATPDVPSIRNAQRLLNRMRQLGAHGDRVRFLLNRAAEPFPIPPKQIEGALGHPIHHMFASDYKLVSTALNSGVPLTQTGKSELATQFGLFTRGILEGEAAEEETPAPSKRVAALGRIGWMW